jgi:chromosome segregation protein
MEIIDKAIAKINRTCRERFRETFDLVAQHYVEIYARLSGGGVGRLQLTDEDDLLTCGVEQFAQPPGKKVHTLSLLSGGEKAMAAIALIFALFRVKPSPFCLLDEVDAPLDEGNGGRFNEMLKEMSRTSQFIVITHNKKTMECADVLYGVTTPEPGISRLVTVRID